MYQVTILDDMPASADLAARAVAASPFAHCLEVTTVTSAQALEQRLSDGEACDILIADIRLSEDASPDGIRVVDQFFGARTSTQIIYLTGYIEYCTQVYETEHVYFLTKPINQEDFNKALAKAIANLEQNSREAFAVKTGKSVISVPYHDIIYIESKLRKLDVHTADKMLTTYGTMSDALDQLPSYFACCHKSFIVNLRQVSRFEGGELIMCDGARIPVSKRRRPEVRTAFFEDLEK